jgi:uncharacterized protein YjbJ (UPF0337 family)
VDVRNEGVDWTLIQTRLHHMQVTTMGTIKRAARQAKGKAKEAIAEVLGDGKLQEEARAEQRNSEEDKDKEPGRPKRLGNLSRLT